jgi:hypothetical protein
MSSKGPWEERVGWLLQPDEYPWKFKPPDSQFYGGQPRIDWLACDNRGRFWMIEVKQIAANRTIFNLDTEISAPQKAALSAVANAGGMALLAIGCGNELFIHDWGYVAWRFEASVDQNKQHPEWLPLSEPMTILDVLPWMGKKIWKLQSLFPLVTDHNGHLAPPMGMRNRPSVGYSFEPTPFPSISKLADSTPTPDQPEPKGLSGPSSSTQKDRPSSSESSPAGGESSSKTTRSGRSSTTPSST